MKKPSATHQTRQQIKALTVRQFQQHLANDLKDLLLPPDIIDPLLKFLDAFPEPVWVSPNDLPEQRSVALTYPYRQTTSQTPRTRILAYLADIPSDPRFWHEQEAAERDAPGRNLPVSALADEYLDPTRNQSFRRLYGEDPPTEWRAAAGKVWLVLDTLRAGAMLATKKGAPRKVTEEKRTAVVASCLKWRPICEDLNRAFKELWKQSEYESAELYRREARGLLAEKYNSPNISKKEVKTLEGELKKGTPTQAMLQMVALDHMDIDVKTIEKIWGEYLDEHPEERRKKRKLLTTPGAGRTA